MQHVSWNAWPGNDGSVTSAGGGPNVLRAATLKRTGNKGCLHTVQQPSGVPSIGIMRLGAVEA
jgi:hypothetical protein